ncbi:MULTISPECIES: hypothetical protein [Lawsonibacter]|jgi:lipoprotein|uniref:Lipoprotein n=1 Tax=Lawsonibacter hominis TaxID=2763053 RepID=A0A8J6JGD0_9FIRM|nr:MULTISPECIES: hypothetical protein [Lawsonibacter]MBS1384926.1 hypothetical protein [Flavonifractor sp.]MDU2196277.1 hypothetical protein [Clostridiales bacterium]MDY2976880.1 hypothetical protein [Oscillospiraceae bacterium]MBC5734724.1 hypothetical protein [Lawsonibacter hominis]MCI6400104.1 hypothetical protein [Lawsonibacter sp.]
MKKKRYLLAAVVVALFALACTAAAAEPEVEAPEQSAYLGDVEVMYVPEWDCYVITTETGSPAHEYVSTQVSAANATRANPEKETSKDFTHTMVDSAGNLIATLDVKVYGIYSQADGEAQITNITWRTTPTVSGMTFRKVLNGETGTLYVKYNQKEIGFTYRIYTNGTISRD